jgi:hypothetical protein
MTIFGNVIRSEAARACGQPEVTTPNDLAWPIHCCKILYCGSIFFGSEVLRFFVLAGNFSLRVLFYVFLKTLAPRRFGILTRPPKGTSLRQSASFEPLSMSVRRSFRSVREPENVNRKKRKMYAKRNILPIWEAPLSDPETPPLAYKVNLPTQCSVSNLMSIPQGVFLHMVLNWRFPIAKHYDP